MKKKIKNGFNKYFFNFNKNIKDIWNGKRSLVYSFWVISTLCPLALLGIGFYLAEYLEGRQDDLSTFDDLLFILYILFLVFVFIFLIIGYVGTLRSAEKYIKAKKRNNLSSFWGKLAQFLIFLSIIRVIIELFKLVKNF